MTQKLKQFDCKNPKCGETVNVPSDFSGSSIKIQQKIIVTRKSLLNGAKSVNLKSELQKLVASYKLHKSRMEKDFEKILQILQQNID